jgi:DNA topoisomerase-3
VYIYDKWSESTLPFDLEVNSIFSPSILTLEEGKTSPPKFLTEADLIDLMEKNGIGTDATMHEHIKTI